MLHLYGVLDSPLKHLFRMRNFKENEMCIFLGFTNGENGFSRNVAKMCTRCAQFGGMSLTGYVTRGWEKEDLMIRTCAIRCRILASLPIRWNAPSTGANVEVHADVRAFCNPARIRSDDAHVACLSAGREPLLHLYHQESDPEAFRQYHAGILSAIHSPAPQ